MHVGKSIAEKNGRTWSGAIIYSIVIRCILTEAEVRVREVPTSLIEERLDVQPGPGRGCARAMM